MLAGVMPRLLLALEAVLAPVPPFASGRIPLEKPSAVSRFVSVTYPAVFPSASMKGILSAATGVTADSALIRLYSAVAAVVPFVPPRLMGIIPLSLVVP